MRVIYPAIFHEEDKSYWVEFPDLKGCYSDGETIAEALKNAKEALSIHCVSILENKESLMAPSNIKEIIISEGDFLSLVEAEIIPKSRAVKKTLTIPSWLNEAAEEKGINFSSILQNALIEELNLIKNI